VQNYTGTTSIGTPGTFGFGVGLAEDGYLDANWTLESDQVLDAGYANYEHTDGGTFCCIPKFYYRIGHPDNPTYATFGVNSIDVRGTDVFSSVIEANLAGYALSRAHIDGNYIKPFVMEAKYMASKKAKGAGYIAASVKNGNPISMHADHNPIAELTACSDNRYYEVINACKGVTGENGAFDADSPFFCTSRFVYAALAMLSLAHGQAVAHNTACAWYDASGVINFPKGCNNNALGDTNDSTVSYVSDGYSNCGKTGSGVPFAKTTHNGQACGVADLNGLMYEISLGVTCIATTKNITAVTNGNPCQLTVVGHGRTTGDPVMIAGIVGMTQLNDKIFTLTVVDVDTITLDGVDATEFGVYTSGGTATFGDFYAASEATAMRDFTSGNSGATDHWGATGAAAMMEAFTPAFDTAYPNNGFSQRIGDGAGQVLSEALAGNGYMLTALGIPKDAGGISTSGSNLFGSDYFYQYIRNELCLLSCAYWNGHSGAGVSAVGWGSGRAYSNYYVGFRAACYPAN